MLRLQYERGNPIISSDVNMQFRFESDWILFEPREGITIKELDVLIFNMFVMCKFVKTIKVLIDFYPLKIKQNILILFLYFPLQIFRIMLIVKSQYSSFCHLLHIDSNSTNDTSPAIKRTFALSLTSYFENVWAR